VPDEITSNYLLFTGFTDLRLTTLRLSICRSRFHIRTSMCVVYRQCHRGARPQCLSLEVPILCTTVCKTHRRRIRSVTADTAIQLELLADCSQPRWLAGSLCQVIAAYALRLNSRAGTEGSTVSSLICDRWLILGLETLSISRCLNHYNRWPPAVCAGRSSIALFTRTAKLDPGAHGARCA